MKTPAPPISVSVTGQTPAAPTSNDPVAVSIVTSQPKSPEERIYLRWSTDTYITSHMVEAVGSGVNYLAVIPAQPAGTSVQYCVTTSTVDLSQVVASGRIDSLTLATTSNTHYVIPSGTPTIQVTVQSAPAGASFTVDGTTYTSAHTFSWAPGSSHTVAATSPQNVSAGVRYTWTRWSDSGAISHNIVPASSNIYTVTFGTQYYLTMTHNTGGTAIPASGWRYSGTAVSISATPGSGYSFTSWTGTGTGAFSGTTNPASITMSGPITETATFTHN